MIFPEKLVEQKGNLIRALKKIRISLKTNIAPENKPKRPKRKGLSSNHRFSGVKC